MINKERMKMRGKFKTYLAGAFAPIKDYQDWRDYVILKVNNKKILLHDPRVLSNQLCPASFTMDDSRGVLDCDILFHYRMRGYEDEGASWEHGIAFACNLLAQETKKVKAIKSKLIIYSDETSVPFPLHFGSADVTFNKLETAVEFLDSLKSLDKQDFMRDYLKLLDKERCNDNK
jgi:hypothetical protein